MKKKGNKHECIYKTILSLQVYTMTRVGNIFVHVTQTCERQNKRGEIPLGEGIGQ